MQQVMTFSRYEPVLLAMDINNFAITHKILSAQYIHDEHTDETVAFVLYEAKDDERSCISY